MGVCSSAEEEDELGGETLNHSAEINDDKDLADISAAQEEGSRAEDGTPFHTPFNRPPASTVTSPPGSVALYEAESFEGKTSNGSSSGAAEVADAGSTPDYCCEGACNGLEIAQNGCKWVRPSKTAVEEEKKVYKVSGFSADTMYCHHFNAAGQHLVLNNLKSSEARHCCGVIYVGFGFSGKSLTCKKQRRPKKPGQDAGHDKCDASKCAFVAEGLQCPYMPLCYKAGKE